MRTLIIPLVVILTVFSTTAAHAAEIKEIRLVGLKKTRRDTVLKIIRFQEGEDIRRQDMKTIRMRLLESDLFVRESLRVRLEAPRDEAVVLILELEERQSLIPIPAAAFGSEGMTGGIFLRDINFLGKGDTLMIGGMLKENGSYFSLGYTDSRVMGSIWDMGGVAHCNHGETSVTSTRREEMAKFDSTVLGGSVFGIWNFRHWAIRLSGGLNAAEYDFLETWTTVFNPTVSLNYKRLQYGRYMNEGFQFEGAAGMRWYSSGLEPAATAAAEYRYQFLPSPRVQLELSGRGLLHHGEELLSPRVESSVLPSTVQADVFAGVSLRMNFVIHDFSWGFLTLPLGYEAGFLDGISAEQEFYQGPSSGLALTLRRSSLPALSFRYGYNLERKKGNACFRLGFSY